MSLALGAFPTPLRRLDALSTERAELWLKDDGLASGLYGGNKVRKLELLLGRAVAAGKRRLVTFGAAGSHHVLATALFGRAQGLEVVALLTPQPWSAHAEETLRASIAAGAELVATSGATSAAGALLRRLRRGDGVIAPGGSTPLGARGYSDAVVELQSQLAEAETLAPDVIVVPVGSGGTAAGLLLGVCERRLPTQVRGVVILRGGPGPSAMVLGLATLARDRRAAGSRPSLRALWRGFSAHQAEGRYGETTREGEEATAVAREVGLELDPTYTAKAFSEALRLLRAPDARAPSRAKGPRRVLYWHTLSAVHPAGVTGALPEHLARLLLR